ncbi:MAG: metal-dependent hydrolase [Stigonema ocellatum SAG 48.90 = DSM 106950]|nr:metal-dependent hydrolase [Stigonema ocellatum SAG 48.90 = DSM 106950]
MMALTHIVVSATATSLLLSTANPALIAIGGIAGLLPDVDISTSWAGRILPWVSHWLERRFPHRSCTHSLFASGVVAVVTYSIVFLLEGRFLLLAHAFNIGFFFGWLLDMFSKSGVEMFWPSTERYVCPGNRKFRLKTGSPAESIVFIMLTVLAITVFNINDSGGMMKQFNRLMATPTGVMEIYNQSGSTHVIFVHIKGVRSGDRSPIDGDFRIVEAKGQDFIVQSTSGEIYKVGTDAEAQIIADQITADVKGTAITNLEQLTIDDEALPSVLDKFKRPGSTVFLTGQLTIDDAQGVNYTSDPYQFPIIKVSKASVGSTNSGSITLEAAPLPTVLEYFHDQYITGQLQLRIINETLTTGNT